MRPFSNKKGKQPVRDDDDDGPTPIIIQGPPSPEPSAGSNPFSGGMFADGQREEPVLTAEDLEDEDSGQFHFSNAEPVSHQSGSGIAQAGPVIPLVFNFPDATPVGHSQAATTPASSVNTPAAMPTNVPVMGNDWAKANNKKLRAREEEKRAAEVVQKQWAEKRTPKASAAGRCAEPMNVEVPATAAQPQSTSSEAIPQPDDLARGTARLHHDNRNLLEQSAQDYEKIAEKEREVDTLKQEITRLLQTQRAADGRIIQLQHDLQTEKQVGAQNIKAAVENQALHSKNAKLEQEVKLYKEQGQAEYDRKQAEVNSKDAELATLQHRILDDEAMIISLHHKCDTLEDENRALQADLEQNGGVKAELEAARHEMEQAFGDLGGGSRLGDYVNFVKEQKLKHQASEDSLNSQHEQQRTQAKRQVQQLVGNLEAELDRLGAAGNISGDEQDDTITNIKQPSTEEQRPAFSIGPITSVETTPMQPTRSPRKLSFGFGNSIETSPISTTAATAPTQPQQTLGYSMGNSVETIPIRPRPKRSVKPKQPKPQILTTSLIRTNIDISPIEIEREELDFSTIQSIELLPIKPPRVRVQTAEEILALLPWWFQVLQMLLVFLVGYLLYANMWEQWTWLAANDAARREVILLGRESESRFIAPVLLRFESWIGIDDVLLG